MLYMCRTTATEAPTPTPWSLYKEVTSGASCEAAGYVSFIDAEECKWANNQLSDNTVDVKDEETFLNQNRFDEPHGCVRNCWDDAASCAGARLDLNKKRSGLSEGCSNQLRCLCKEG